MLQITNAAEAAIRDIKTQNEIPEAAPLRIHATTAPGGEVAIGFAFSDREEGDQTVSQADDFPVYISPELALPLSDAVLDANVTDQGVELELRTSGDPGEAPLA